MPVQRWTLYNPSTGITLTFPRNPIEGVLPEYEKNVDLQTTTSPDGQPLMFQGRDKPRTMPFSGSIRDKEHFDFMLAWYRLSVPVTVTDHLGNTFSLYLVRFAPKPKNRHNNPWAANFDAAAVVLGSSL